MRSRTVRLLLTTALLYALGHATAAASLKLGASLPGFDEVRSGNLHRAATQLVGDYSAQVRHFCVQPEVFTFSSTGTLQGARSAYESSLPAAARQRVLVDGVDQRVTMVILPSSGNEVIVVLALAGPGVVLIVC